MFALVVANAAAWAAGGAPLLTVVWTAESNQPQSRFGWSAGPAGDVNGDGFDDIVVGAPQLIQGPGGDFFGQAYVFHGSTYGPDVAPAWTFASQEQSDYFAWSVASAGDVNGDGFSDVVVGAPYADGTGTIDGRASLFLGSAAGLDLVPAWEEPAPAENALFGQSVASAGDVNGDGYADVVVGAPAEDVTQTDEGRAYVYLGSATGLEVDPAWDHQGNQGGASFGYAVSSAGDVDGDGFDDLLVGANLEDVTGANDGRAYVFLGSSTGLATVEVWAADANAAASWFGASVASAGDVDGDGFGDVIVGAPQFSDGEAIEGAAFLYNGSSTGPSVAAVWSTQGNEPFAVYGDAVASAGDVDADGFDDVVVGQYQHNAGQFGEGRAVLYLGSAAGLAALGSWDEEGNVMGANFGDSVGSAGDTNGDGLDDLIVGAPSISNGESLEGRAFVYLGGEVLDSDGDGVPDGSDVCQGDDASGDGDLDGFCALDVDATVEDCDDTDATVYPGATEACDGADNDCSGSLDPNEADADLDSFRVCDGDCDDTDPTSFPGAPQLCDGVDNSCEGAVPADELDADADGVQPCAGDCDDTQVAAAPGLDETCDDGIDNDCDNGVDEGCEDVAPPPPDEEGCNCDGSATGGRALLALAATWLVVRRRARPPASA